VIVLDIAEGATQRLMLARGDIDYARDLDKTSWRRWRATRRWRSIAGPRPA